MKALCQASEHTIDCVDVGFFVVNFKIMCFYYDFVIIVYLFIYFIQGKLVLLTKYDVTYPSAEVGYLLFYSILLFVVILCLFSFSQLICLPCETVLFFVFYFLCSARSICLMNFQLSEKLMS